jgi:phosphoserine phosphatase RsbU/P
MATPGLHDWLRAELKARQERLEETVTRSGSEADLHLRRLMAEVDAALERMAMGTYGLCETCHDPIETERLLADPLICTCLDHLTIAEQRALERDLELAARIQQGLLPPMQLERDGWHVARHFSPAGPVSGDYCDVVLPEHDGGDLLLLLGDVSGKGVSASLLMSNLHATFRSLAGNGFTVATLMERANRLFCQSAMAGHYATLVCAKASPDGGVEVANAGHCPLLLMTKDGMATIEANGVPLGLFGSSVYAPTQVRLEAGDTMLLYTDGLSEARNEADEEYGADRIASIVSELCRQGPLEPSVMMQACLEDVTRFAGKTRRHDDLAMMAVRRAGA